MHYDQVGKEELSKSLILWIKELARKERESIGFLPITYYQSSWLRRRLLIHVEGSQPTGFLHWSHLRGSQRKTIHINQLCVQRDARRWQHATLLIIEVICMSENNQVDLIWLKCAAELESNMFWAACGGRVLEVLLPHTARRRPINIWEFDVASFPPRHWSLFV